MSEIVKLAPFWRSEPLSEQETALLDALMQAHHASCFRGNESSEAVIRTAISSGQYANAIAAAVLTTGGMHAPIGMTMRVLSSFQDGDAIVEEYVSKGMRVPGWGNSFIKGKKDDLWLGVDALIEQHWTPTAKRMEGITFELHKLGKMIYPNPSAYTAACALILGMPPFIAPILFFLGRLAGWTELIARQLKH